MTEQPKYKLYAIKTAELPQDGLKRFEYSLYANSRYALVYAVETLVEPYHEIPEGTPLTDEEQAFVTNAKLEINAKFAEQHKLEYIDLMSDFLTALEKELSEESLRAGEQKRSKKQD